jgi:hypothetical protein
MKTKQAFVYSIFAVILALVFAACGDGDGGGGGGGKNPGDKEPGDDNPTVNLGETLTLTGQVYEWDYDNYSFRRYNGSSTVEAGYYHYEQPYDFISIGGSGAITNGQLNFTIGKPDHLVNLDYLMSDPNNDYTNIQYSKENVRGVSFSNLNGNAGILSNQNITDSETDNSHLAIHEGVGYIYVEEDVTVSGKGKTQTGTYENDIRYTHTTKDFTLALKKGWNALYYLNEIKETFSGTHDNPTNINETITNIIFLSNPTLRWLISGQPHP